MSDPHASVRLSTPPIKLMDTQLKLDPTFMLGLPGWSVQTDLGQASCNLDLDLPSDWDDPLCRACGDFASAMRLNPNQDPSAAGAGTA